MADIKVRLEVNPDAETELLGDLGVDNASKVSNTSYKVDLNNIYQNIQSTQTNRESLSLAKGYLVFNNEGYLANEDTLSGFLQSEESPQQFVWGATDSNGNYEVTLTFTNANDLDKITIYGDTTANQFPTEAYLDGSANAINSDDAQWDIAFDTASTNHTIRFTKWNRANYNAVITLVTVAFKYYDINKFNGLISVESLSQSTPDPKSINYGVIANTGSFEAVDVNGDIKEMIGDNIISNSNLEFEVLVNGKQVQSHISNDSEYNIQSNTFSLSSSNKLQNWDNLQYNGMEVQQNTSLYETLHNILSILYDTVEIDAMLQNHVVCVDGIERTVYDYLHRIIIPYNYLLEGSIRDSVDKVCQIAQLNVFQDDFGQIQFVSARPKITADKSIISLPRKCQYSAFERDFILKNKINSVFVPINTLEYTYKSLITKQTQTYKFDSYSSVYSLYTNILESQAYNPNITILANHIGAANNTINSGWFYSIYKFNQSLPTEDVRHTFSFKWNVSWTYWIDGQGETTSDLHNTDVIVTQIYNNNESDNEIISSWVNFNGSTPETVKVGAPNNSIKIKMNGDNTITIYVIELTDILVSVFNEVKGLYNVHNYRIYNDSYTSSFNEKTSVYDFEYTQNELFQNGTLFYNTLDLSASIDYIDALKNSITNDYASGLISGKLSVACLDYYSIASDKVKDWSQGDILEVGDIVRVDKDNAGTSVLKYANGQDMYFKVTGRHFRYKGVPMLDLELQEVKQDT